MKKFLIACALATTATQAAAFPTLSDCGGWQAQPQHLAEPWFENTVTFSDGQTRLALIDTVEPASGAWGLLILSPPYDDYGIRQCRLLHGFSGLSMGSLSAYDPSIGLQITLIGSLYLEDQGEFANAQVDLTIYQATGDIDHFITPYFE